MSYDHYIPQSEAKARRGCFNVILAVVLIPLISSIIYSIINKIEFDALLIIGLTITFLGIALSTKKKVIERKGFKTKGRVIDFQPDIRSKGHDKKHSSQYLIVKFLNQKGAMKREQIENSYAVGKYNRGDELRVIIYGDKIYEDPGISMRNSLVVSFGVLIIILDLAF